MNASKVFTRANIMAAVAVAAIGFCVMRLGGSDGDGPPVERTRSADVKRVVSGHKIKIKPDDRVIYAGIRAPYPGAPFADEALERNRQLVEGQRVRMRFGEKQKDDKGRWLSYVFVDGEMVNRRLVEEGLAYVRLREGEGRFAEELLQAQKEARAARRGMWAKAKKSSAREYPGDSKHATFHRPDCEDVANSRPGREVVFGSMQDAFDAGFAPCGHCQP